MLQAAVGKCPCVRVHFWQRASFAQFAHAESRLSQAAGLQPQSMIESIMEVEQAAADGCACLQVDPAKHATYTAGFVRERKVLHSESVSVRPMVINLKD